MNRFWIDTRLVPVSAQTCHADISRNPGIPQFWDPSISASNMLKGHFLYIGIGSPSYIFLLGANIVTLWFTNVYLKIKGEIWTAMKNSRFLKAQRNWPAPCQVNKDYLEARVVIASWSWVQQEFKGILRTPYLLSSLIQCGLRLKLN